MSEVPGQRPTFKATANDIDVAKAIIAVLQTLEGHDQTMDGVLAFLFSQEDSVIAQPLTGSVDAVLERIEIVFPRWSHGYSWFPQADCDKLIETRAWIGGPGHITDDYMGDYFEGEAATPALALLIALLRGLIHDGLEEQV